VATNTIAAQFLEHLIPGAPAGGRDHAGGLPMRTRHGNTVNVLRWNSGTRLGELSRPLRRGLPTIIVIAPDTPPDALAAVEHGWRRIGTLAAPTIAVLLSDDIRIPAVWREGGPDLIACLGHGRRPAPTESADIEAATPAELAAATDVALAILRCSLGPPDPAGTAISGLVPLTPGTPYNLGAVIERLLDGGRLVQVRRPSAPELVTGFAAVAGSPVAVLASRPDYDHGRLTPPGVRRLSRFLTVVERLGTPLLSVVDTCGMSWAAGPDTLEVLRDALLAMYNLSVPKFVLVAGNAYGTAAPLYGVVGMRADLVAAWPRGHIGADPEVSLAESSVIAAARSGHALDVIHPDETYRWLLEVTGIAAAARPKETSSVR
jgi:Carboxyl transferase domain